MLPHTKSEFSGSRTDCCHVFEVLPEFFRGEGNPSVPACELLRCVNSAEILVARSVSEPASHLHQGVIHACRTQVVADCESFECESSRQLVSSDHDDAQSVRPVPSVVQDVKSGAVD